MSLISKHYNDNQEEINKKYLGGISMIEDKIFHPTYTTFSTRTLEFTSIMKCIEYNVFYL